MSRLNRFLNLWRGRSLEAEFDEELRFHRDMRIEANLRAGMSRADAELEAQRHLGGTLRAKEGMREARVMTWIETLGRDLRYGARLFSRQPGTTFLAVLTLSLGIGANAVISSLLHAVLLRPLPFPNAERLIAIIDNFRTDGLSDVPPTVPELLDVKASSRHLDAVSFYDMRDVQISGGTEPARAFVARIDASFLPMLGVRPARGRLFVEGEGSAGRDRVVILTDAFWRRNFGGDPAIVNRSIVVNGTPNTVIGVLPADFSFDYLSAEPIELYVPFPMNAAYTSRTGEYANVRRVVGVGRLRPGVTVEQGAAEVETISRHMASAHPQLYRRGSDGQDRGFAMSVTPLRDILVGRSRAVVLLLFGAVGLVLLIACVNTAQFLLARALERQQEVAIRAALGAGGGRLIRQFLAEASLLAVVAAGAGLLQAAWLTDGLGAMLASRSPLVAELGLNGPVIVFAVVVAVLVTIACGVFPAMRVCRGTPLSGLTGRTADGSRSGTRQLLIAVEVAVSIVLLVCAGLLAQGIRQLQTAPTGYSTENVTVMRMRVSGRAAAGGTGKAYQRYLEEISAIPGVAAAAVADAPLHGLPGVEFAVIGRSDDAATLSEQRASWRIVSPGYFSALGIPILAGRSFADHDASDRPRVAIVNEAMARRLWPGRSPLGQQIRSGVGPRLSVTTIVGVAGDVRPPLQEDAGAQIYVSYLQQSEPSITLLVRSAPRATVSPVAIKRAVWSVVPDQPLFEIRSMADVVEQPISAPRLVARLLGAFALLALLMSTMGVYTVVAYLTARRTREVALRRAIGARAIDVLRLLATQTMRSTLVGLAIGVAGAAAATNLLRTVVLGTARLDVATVAGIGVIYLAVVAVAMCVPAARALRIDPARILRAE